MKKVLAAIAILAFASVAFAQRIDETNGKHTQLYPTKDHPQGWAKPGGGGSQNLSYHGGPVVTSAKAVEIFWGPSWSSGTTLNDPVALELLDFFNTFGQTGEYNTITQYSGIQKANLTYTFWWDNSTPPTNVTDADLVNEVIKYFGPGGGTPDASTIYSVLLPSTSYSSFGTSTSCG